MKYLLLLLASLYTLHSYGQCWREIAVGGGNHKVAIKTDGTLWASGTTWYLNYNGFEQIGTDSDWQSVSTGRYHFLALKNDGTLWSWGHNSDGQLGDGTFTSRSMPVQVGNDSDWRFATSGDTSNIAIKVDGTMWIWGDNHYNQLGLGNWQDINTPTQIGNDSDWVSASNGNTHSLAIKADGTLWSWGNNHWGELGNGWGVLNPSGPAQIGIDNNWASISAGDTISAAIKNDGTLWMWGYNYYGSLGIIGQSEVRIPTQVGSATDWMSVAAKREVTIALKRDQTLWVWGENSYGQLGNGTTNSSNVPIQTANNSYIGATNRWVKIAADWYGCSVIRDDFTLWKWGHNYTGPSRPTRESCTNLSTHNLSTQEFTVFPNPTNQFLNIQNTNNQSIERITVLDITGNRVKEEVENLTRLNVQELQSGIYFVQIKSQDKSFTQKFVRE